MVRVDTSAWIYPLLGAECTRTPECILFNPFAHDATLGGSHGHQARCSAQLSACCPLRSPLSPLSHLICYRTEPPCTAHRPPSASHRPGPRPLGFGGSSVEQAGHTSRIAIFTAFSLPFALPSIAVFTARSLFTASPLAASPISPSCRAGGSRNNFAVVLKPSHSAAGPGPTGGGGGGGGGKRKMQDKKREKQKRKRQAAAAAGKR